MIKRIDRYFEGEPKEEEMAGYKVRLAHNTKFYEGDDRKLVVWTLAQCVKKLREGRKTDPTLNEATLKMADWKEAQEKDLMTQKWADDCRAVWEKAHEIVLNETPEDPPAAQETPEPVKKSLFKGRKKDV